MPAETPRAFYIYTVNSHILYMSKTITASNYVTVGLR